MSRNLSMGSEGLLCLKNELVLSKLGMIIVAISKRLTYVFDSFGLLSTTFLIVEYSC